MWFCFLQGKDAESLYIYITKAKYILVKEASLTNPHVQIDLSPDLLFIYCWICLSKKKNEIMLGWYHPPPPPIPHLYTVSSKITSIVWGTSWPATTEMLGTFIEGTVMLGMLRLGCRKTTELPSSATNMPSWITGMADEEDGEDESDSCTKRMVCTAASSSSCAEGSTGSLACRRMCLSRLGRERKAVGQRGQTYGRSPLCTRACSVSLAATLKLLPHTQHVNGRSPLWMRSWSCRCGSCRKRFPQWVHWNRCEKVWKYFDDERFSDYDWWCRQDENYMNTWFLLQRSDKILVKKQKMYAVKNVMINISLQHVNVNK